MKINKLLKKIAIVALFLVPNFLFAQLGVNSDNSAPSNNAMLDVKSSNKGVLIPRVGADLASPTEGLLYYNTTGHNFRYYDGTAWQNALFGNQWNVNGNKISYSLGNVGINNTNPLYNLDVNGTLHTEGYGYIDGFLSVGGNAIFPSYKLQVNDGSMAIYNSGEGKIWTLNYAAGVGLRVMEDGLNARMTFDNGGNIGIGTSTPAYKLDVVGAIRASGNIQTQSDLSVTGDATVNGGKGVAYNTLGATNLKIFPFTTATFGAVLGPHDSAVTSIVFGGGFTSTPRVFVGDIDYTAGPSGELERVILILRGCTYSAGTGNTTCVAKIVNTDDASLNYDIRWNMLAVGY
jgi:hypothetical protein